MLKNIVEFIILLAIVVGMVFLFFNFTLPALQQDVGITVAQEIAVHTQTLEKIKQDFSYVLSDENVSVRNSFRFS